MKKSHRLVRNILLFSLLFLAAGCVTADYMGESYPPTSNVDTYFDKQDIKRDYKVMGQITLDADDFLGNDKIMQKMREEAMNHGADAVIVTGMQKIRTGETTEWQDTSKHKGKHDYQTGTATTQYETKKEVTGELVKYTYPQPSSN